MSLGPEGPLKKPNAISVAPGVISSPVFLSTACISCLKGLMNRNSRSLAYILYYISIYAM